MKRPGECAPPIRRDNELDPMQEPRSFLKSRPPHDASLGRPLIQRHTHRAVDIQGYGKLQADSVEIGVFRHSPDGALPTWRGHRDNRIQRNGRTGSQVSRRRSRTPRRWEERASIPLHAAQVTMARFPFPLQSPALGGKLNRSADMSASLLPEPHDAGRRSRAFFDHAHNGTSAPRPTALARSRTL